MAFDGPKLITAWPRPERQEGRRPAGGPTRHGLPCAARRRRRRAPLPDGHGVTPLTLRATLRPGLPRRPPLRDCWGRDRRRHGCWAHRRRFQVRLPTAEGAAIRVGGLGTAEPRSRPGVGGPRRAVSRRNRGTHGPRPGAGPVPESGRPPMRDESGLVCVCVASDEAAAGGCPPIMPRAPRSTAGARPTAVRSGPATAVLAARIIRLGQARGAFAFANRARAETCADYGTCA